MQHRTDRIETEVEAEELDYDDDLVELFGEDDLLEPNQLADDKGDQVETSGEASMKQRANDQLLDEDEMEKDPRILNTFEKLLGKRIQDIESQILAKVEKQTKTPTGNKVSKEHKNGKKEDDRTLIKSPSDTTLYAPALQKQTPVLANQIGVLLNLGSVVAQPHNDNLEMISNFVESVRLAENPADKVEMECKKASANASMPELDEARQRSEKAIVEAEKF